MQWYRTWRQLHILTIVCVSMTALTTGMEDFGYDCNDNYFKCKSGKCISKSFICDGEVDCGGSDSSDEESCHLLTTKAPEVCESGEFRCTDSLCIPERWVCDGQFDCADGSDELHGCSSHTCDPLNFQCKSKGCIPKEWHCDGSRDCSDNSDEENCPEKSVSPEKCDLHDGFFLCRNKKKCINLSSVCNHHADCEDGSDEGNKCYNTDLCKTQNCAVHERCVNLPDGATCLQFCLSGYQYVHGSCEDIDECGIFGRCDQICDNTVGGYNCSCNEGYVWSTEHKICKAEGGEGMMMFSSNDQVRAYFLESGVYYEVASGLPHATGITYDGVNVYWSTIADGQQTLVKANDHGNNFRTIVTSGIGSAEDLAIDMITKLLYFTDIKYKHIGVCSNDGYICAVLHSQGVDKPRAIALHSSEGFMYWTDWGVKPMIAKAGMDGSQVTPFVTEDIKWPNGLSIDHGTGRLYWVDAKDGKIECIKLDGHDRRKISSTAVQHPFSIEIFENKIYWSDWDSNQIQACNKFTGHECHVIVRERNHKIYGIHIYHPSLWKPDVANPCYEAHCSDLCLLAPKNHRGHLQYTCACPDHKTLSKDNHTCVPDNTLDLVLVGSGQSLVKVEHKSFGGFLTNTVQLSHLRKIGALAFDPNSDTIFISDVIAKCIIAYNWKLNETNILVEHVGNVIGMDMDYFANNLYWVDEEKKTVEVMNVDKKYRRTLLRDFGDESPTDIALVLEAGYMFIAFSSTRGAHIDRVSMDGRMSTRRHVLEGELIGPLTMFFDTTLARLFVADRNAGLITTTDAEGTDRHNFFQMDSAPVDVAALHEDVFWVTYGSNRLFWSNKFDPGHYKKTFILESLQITDEIKIMGIHTHPVLKMERCSKAGNCSHFCLLSHENAVCGCPDGMELGFDKETCSKQLICKENEYKCLSGECIDRSLRCNGREDCKEGDDEAHCLKACSKNEFSCMDGKQCVPVAARCNQRLDCQDNSDEHNCELVHRNCTNGEFHCASGECVSMINRCDMNFDCLDESDESHCDKVQCTSAEFRCSSGSCIPSSWACDLQIDCTDASDEGDHCKKEEECKEFTCGNGHCISKFLLCNGEDDCEDMSDETHCAGIKEAKVQCDFACKSQPSICHPVTIKCDGNPDCPDGEDELNCNTCSEVEFKCKSKKCIPKEWVCDNVNDCGDHSDEEHCLNESTKAVARKHEDKHCEGWLCKDSNACLPLHKLCDGTPDCADASDETGHCGRGSCAEAGCQHECQETPEGPKCSCRLGYQLSGDGRTCKDLDECQSMSSCSQICQNTVGSYRCSCIQPAYHLKSDKITCKAKGGEMKYYFATEKLIKLKTQSLLETNLVYRSLYNLDIKGMDVDVQKQIIYWISERSGHLVKMSIENPSDISRLSNLVRPTKMAFDWISENVYILENFNTIHACNFAVMKCGLLYRTAERTSLDTFALDPYNRMIFWVETTRHFSKQSTSALKKATMAFTNNVTLFVLDKVLDGDILADPVRKLIYWTDTEEKTIQRSDYDGKERHLVALSQNTPLNLMLFEDYLYWLNGEGKGGKEGNDYFGSLTRFGLYGRAYMSYQTIRLLPPASSTRISAVKIVHEALQIPGYNTCRKSTCQELCISDGSTAHCLCQNGLQIKPGETCPNNSTAKIRFHPSETSHNTTESATSLSWLWWILSLLLVGIIAGAAYFFYDNFYQNSKFAERITVMYPNERAATETSEAGLERVLAPGQHQYENPTFSMEGQPGVKFVIPREIDLS